MNQEGIRGFFDGWALYEAVLDGDLMFHDAIFAGLGRRLAGRFGDRPLRVLDLGCGSARHVVRALAGRNVLEFVGCDLSPRALDHARENLRSLAGRVSLREADLLDFLGQVEGPFDLVVSSYALHHLDPAGKARAFAGVRRVLSDDGWFALVDVHRVDDEDRARYLDGYLGWMRRAWAALPPAWLDHVEAHVRDCDFPETAAGWRSLADGAGFGSFIQVADHARHGCWIAEVGASMDSGPMGGFAVEPA